MDYGMLKEMPRFWVSYGIKFYTEEKKQDILNLFNQINIDKTFFIKEILKEEQETFSINIEFCQKLFCGFSISDAINYLFLEDNIMSILEIILAEYSNEIKDISLSIEC